MAKPSPKIGAIAPRGIGIELRHAIEFDHGEDLITRLVPATEIPGMIAKGRFGHSLVIVALAYYDLRRRGVR